MPRRRESPVKRTNPSGKEVWLARWTDKTGKRRYGWKPDIPGTYPLRRQAQEAIDACYERDAHGPSRPDTVGGYAETWTTTRPRAKRTNKTNEYRLNAVLDVEIEGVKLRDWPFEQLRRKQANAIIDHLLRVDGRAYTGARAIMGTLNCMAEDALDDEVIIANPFRGAKVRANDPRVQKGRRPIRVWDWPQMHAYAKACAEHTGSGEEMNEWRRRYAEPMARMLTDCGLRIGELFPLYTTDLNLKEGVVEVRWTATPDGEVMQGTKTDHGLPNAGRVAPIPPTLCGMLRTMLEGRSPVIVPQGDRRDQRLRPEALLFPSPRGCLWRYSDWRESVWLPGQEATGIDPRPHELRHSWVSLMRAAGIDPADLAEIGGHTVGTQTKIYTHALRRSYDAVREAVGK